MHGDDEIEDEETDDLPTVVITLLVEEDEGRLEETAPPSAQIKDANDVSGEDDNNNKSVGQR